MAVQHAVFASVLALLACSSSVTGSPLKIVKVFSLGAGPEGADTIGATLGSSVSIGVPPLPDLAALNAWKKAILAPLFPPPVPPLPPLPPLVPLPKPPPPPPPKPKPQPAPSPPNHHHHHSGDCCCSCCCCDDEGSSSDSSAASSEEDFVGSEEARIQRCVRNVAPNMLVDNTYIHVAKVDACAARGMQAVVAGKPPADVSAAVAACVDASAFPEKLAPFADDFKACVDRVLT